MMMTRRAWLKSGGLALFSIGVGGTPLFLTRAARGATLPPGGRRRVLVTIFQRGAMDGLMAVSPYTDPLWRTHRPGLAMMPAGTAEGDALIDLDGRFGLHPGFAPFAPLFRDGRLAIVHGMGSPDTTRSHFDAQDYMESGTPGRKGTASGWLNRAVGLLGHEGTPFRAVAMTSALPLSLYGNEPALAIADLDSFGLRGGNRTYAAAAGRGFEDLYDRTSQQLLRGAGRESFEATKILSSRELATYRPADGARYPNSPIGRNLKQVASLIKGDVGLEVAFVESTGWDTHVQQGRGAGTFARHAHDLAGAIAAFWTDLGDRHDDVVLMTMTEFGRTVRENGSGGTDHGRASCLFLLGSDVSGGKVHGNVASLDPAELEDGRDLPVTTDFRSIFADVAGRHLGVSKDNVLFPGWDGKRTPLFRS